ncbi:MAG: type 4a pilus biogenesis protein PilO [Candidatus Omnitrophota bacterium]
MDILKHLSKRERTILYLTVGIVVCISGYNLILSPLFKMYGELNQEVLAKRIALEKATRLIGQKENIENEYKKFSSILKASGSVQEQMAELLSEIEAIARRDAIPISNMRPQPIQDKKFYKKFIIEIKCEAEMSRLLKFFYELETSKSLLKIESLKVNPRVAESPILEASLIISKISLN